MIQDTKSITYEDDKSFADTSFIEEVIPFRNADPKLRRLVGFEFKPQAIFSEVRDSSLRFKHQFNKWIATKYSFRATSLVMSDEHKCVTLDWNLGEGVHLATQNKDPVGDYIEEEPKNLYLVFLYRKKDEWNGANALFKLREFIQHLEEMPESNPIENVYLRATGIEQRNWKHLNELGYLPNEKATSERLLKVYRKILGCSSWTYKDVDGLPYQVAKYRPKNPKVKSF